MATPKKFLDKIGLARLWSKIQNELNKKADQSNLDSLENRVEEIETAELTIYGGSAFDVIDEGGE